MAAFKTLNAQDKIVSPLHLNKGFRFEGQSALLESNVNIGRYLGSNIEYIPNETSTGPSDNSKSQALVYNQIKQLYYSNYISGSDGEISNVATASFNPDGTITGVDYSPAYQNYLESTLPAKRYFPTGSNETIGILSIPQYLFGDYIKPNSISIITDSGSYFDDGEGRLKRRVNDSSPIYVGNVIYEHGIIVLTGGTRNDRLGEVRGYGEENYGGDVYGGRLLDSEDILNFVTGSNITCSFSSSYTIFETQYKCTIGENEFNMSQNPSLSSGSNGDLLDFAIQDYFSPYVTTVGLFNDQRDLIAVGKMAQPLPTSKTTDTTILINIDRQ